MHFLKERPSDSYTQLTNPPEADWNSQRLTRRADSKEGVRREMCRTINKLTRTRVIHEIFGVKRVFEIAVAKRQKTTCIRRQGQVICSPLLVLKGRSGISPAKRQQPKGAVISEHFGLSTCSYEKKVHNVVVVVFSAQDVC